MKKIRLKILSLVCVLSLIYSSFGTIFSAFAGDRVIGKILVDTSAVDIIENTGSIDSNIEFKVPIRITENDGFASLTFTLDYGSSFNLVRVETGDLAVVSEQGDTGKYSNEVDIMNPVTISSTGVFATAVFKVSEDTASGIHNINLIVGANGETTDANFESVTFDVTLGSVKVVQSTDVKSIAATGTIYYDGSTYKAGSDFKVTATLYDNTTKDLSASEYQISGVGETATITYSGIDYVGDTAPTTIVTTTAKAVASITNVPSLSGKKGATLESLISGNVSVTYNDGTTGTVALTKEMIQGDYNDQLNTQTLKVVIDGVEADITITLANLAVTSIADVDITDKYVGTELADVLSGVKFTATYEDDSTAEFDISKATPTEGNQFDSGSTAQQTLTYTFGEQEFNVNITLKTDVITSISVTGPTKTEYFYGDQLDLTGLTVTADYESGRTGVTLDASSYTVSPADATAMNTLGTNTITVTANEKTATTSVNVKDYVASISAAKGEGFKESYVLSGHETADVPFDPTGLEVTGTTASGKTETLSLKDVTVTADISTANDAVPVNVSYVNEKGETLTDDHSVTVSVTGAVVSKVVFNTENAKKSYYVGDELDITGITIAVKYDNCPEDCAGHSVVVDSSMVSGFDSSAANAAQKLTVSYNGETSTYDVVIKEDVLTDITLNTTELNAVVGDASLNTSAIRVTEVWESGKAGSDITNDCTFDTKNVNLNAAGTYTMTVTYQKFSKSITVNVAEADKVVGISATPEELTFTVGDTLDTSSIVVNEVYKSGSKKTLTSDDYTIDVSAVKMNTAGEYVITVQYKKNTSFTDTIKVTVNAKYIPSYPIYPIYPSYPPVDYYPPVTTKPVTKPEKVEDGWHGDQYYQDGEPVVGWLEVTHGTWYYFDRSGSMVTGWEKVNGTWYYMLDSGVMATGWVKVDGSWYFLKNSGAMATGWLWDNGHWYYLSGSGAMKTGWVLSGSKWYYLNASGAMVTGWVEWKGDWYYMNTPNGDMAVDTKTPDGYYVNSDGIWVK